MRYEMPFKSRDFLFNKYKHKIDIKQMLHALEL